MKRSPRLRLTAIAALLLHFACSVLAGQLLQAGGGNAASSTGKGGANTGSGNTAGGGNQGNNGGGVGSGGTAYFETQMLAYGAVNQLAGTIAGEVCKLPPASTVIIFDQASFQNLQMWQSFQASARLLAGAYNTLYQKGGNAQRDKQFQDKVQSFSQGPSWAGATEFGALSGLATALAASTTNNASTFTIQDSTLAVSIAHQVKRCAQQPALVYYPLFGSYVDAANANFRVNETMERLNQVRAEVQTQILFPTGGGTPPGSTVGTVVILQDLNAQYDLLFNSLLAPTVQAAGVTVGTAPAGATSLVQGADLEYRLQQPNTYVLYADVVAAGGTQIDRKNIITVLLTGDWISYSGGLIANVSLTKSDTNSLVFADTLRYRTARWLPFATVSHPVSSKTIEKTNAGDNESSICNQDAGIACLASGVLDTSGVNLAGGSDGVVTIDLTMPAPTAGAVVSLTAADTGLVSIPAPGTVTVPAGQTHGECTVHASAVTSVMTTTIRATYGGVTRQIPVKLIPLLGSVGVAPPIALVSVIGSSPTFAAGDGIDLYADLNRPAPNDISIILKSKATGAFGSINGSMLTIPQGSTRGMIHVNTLKAPKLGDGVIGMTYAGVTKTVTVINVGP